MRNSSLTILFLTMFLIMLGFGIIIPHLAYYAEDLGASPTQIGGLMAVYSAMQLIFAPIWGRISDRRGRKPAILIGLIGNAGALALFGIASTLKILFIARGLSGVLSAAVLPTVMAYVADVTTEEERGKGMGLMGAAMGLGFIMGPAIGGIMGEHDLPFFAAGGLSLVTFVFALLFLPESLTLAKHDELSATATEESDQRERQWHTSSAPSHNREPWLSPGAVLRRGTWKHPLTPLFLVAFFSTLVFSGLETTFPLFIKDRFQYGQREMGWMFAIMGTIVALLQGGILGRLINRFGEFKLIILGLILNAVGMALLPWADGFLTLTVYLTITGIGHQIVRPTNTSWVSKQTKIGQGTAIGIMDTFLSLGRVFGPSAGKLYSPQTFQIPYWVSAAILVIASIGLFFPLRQLAISDRRNKENVSAVKK